MSDSLRSNGPYSLIPAALMLYFGWMVLTPWEQPESFLQTTGNLLCWTLRLGGVGMGVVALLYFAGLPAARPIETIVSGGAGLLMVFGGGCGVVIARGGDFQAILYVVFGLMFLREARQAWRVHRAALAGAGAEAPVAAARPVSPAAPESPHPASIRPASLADADRNPPPDGYLDALAKEDDKPPTASYE